MSELILTCKCGQKNRAPWPVAPGRVVNCGKCHATLAVGGPGPCDDDDDDEADDDFDDRDLGGDDE